MYTDTYCDILVLFIFQMDVPDHGLTYISLEGAIGFKYVIVPCYVAQQPHRREITCFLTNGW